MSDTVAPFAIEPPPPDGASDAEARGDRDTVKRPVPLPKRDADPGILSVALAEEHADTVAERLARAESVEAADSEPLAVPTALTVGVEAPVGVADDAPPAEKRTKSPEFALRRYEESNSEFPGESSAIW